MHFSKKESFAVVTNDTPAVEAKGIAALRWTRVEGVSIVQGRQPQTLVSRIQRRLQQEERDGVPAKVSPREIRILRTRLLSLQQSGGKFQHATLAPFVSAPAETGSRYLGGELVATEA